MNEENEVVIVRRKDIAKAETAEIKQSDIDEIAKAERIEAERLERIKRKKENFEKNSTSYKTAKYAKVVLDDYFVDGLVGFVVPGLGDAVNGVLVLPMIYLSLIKIKSIPLTIVIIFNLMLDTLVGLVPFLGDFVDFFFKGYKRSYRLIVGFVEEDEQIKKEVRRKALTAFVLTCLIGYITYSLVGWLVNWISGLFS